MTIEDIATKEAKKILSKEGRILYTDLEEVDKITWDAYKKGFISCFLYLTYNENKLYHEVVYESIKVLSSMYSLPFFELLPIDKAAWNAFKKAYSDCFERFKEITKNLNIIKSNSLCLDCGTAKEDFKNGTCINGHANWLTIEDGAKEFELAIFRFDKPLSEIIESMRLGKDLELKAL